MADTAVIEERLVNIASSQEDIKKKLENLDNQFRNVMDRISILERIDAKRIEQIERDIKENTTRILVIEAKGSLLSQKTKDKVEDIEKRLLISENHLLLLQKKQIDWRTVIISIVQAIISGLILYRLGVPIGN